MPNALNYKNLADNTVLSIIAPTASGKTALAYELYETGRFELISVDSALIYQDMNIGTAKPTADELARYPHHLVDIIAPTETYSVADFVQSVDTLIQDTHNKNKIPLLVGGTMMYYMALFDGISDVPATDSTIRQEVADWLKSDGIHVLYQYLQDVDGEICQKLKVSDTQRITRAVEVYKQTGVPLSSWQKKPKIALSHNVNQNWLAFNVEPPRDWLHERIALRLEMMWAEGFVDEVIELIKKYPNLDADMPSMRCVGYRQVLEFLALTGHESIQSNVNFANLSQKLQNDNKNYHSFAKNCHTTDKKHLEISCQDMKNKALYATRQLAKRQSTWQRQLAKILNDGNGENFGKSNVSMPKILSYHGINDVKRELIG